MENEKVVSKDYVIKELKSILKKDSNSMSYSHFPDRGLLHQRLYDNVSKLMQQLKQFEMFFDETLNP